MDWESYRRCLLLWLNVLLTPGPYPGEPLFPAVGSLAAQFLEGLAQKTHKNCAFLALLGVGEGLAPPESPKAMPG